MPRRIAVRPRSSPGARLQDGPAADRLRAASAAAYGPGADAAAADRLRVLQERPATSAAVPALRRRPGLAVGVLLALALGFALGWTTRPTPQTTQQLLQQRVLDSRGALAAEDYERLYPGGLPSDWSGAGAGTSRRAIRGAAVLPLTVSEASSRLLVVPACTAADRFVDWRLTGRDGRVLGDGRTACGRFEGQVVDFSADDRAGGLRLAVVPGGPVPFAVTVYEQ